MADTLDVTVPCPPCGLVNAVREQRKIARICAALGLSMAVPLAACGGGSTAENQSCARGSCADAAAGDAKSDASPTDAAAGNDQTDGGGGAPEASADVSVDQSTAMDDPCPSQTLNYLNCSNSCANPKSCSNDSCTHSGAETTIDSWSQLPFVIRTPSHPGIDPACPTDCGVSEVYALTVLLMLPSSTTPMNIEVTVEPPWHVADFGGVTGGPFCPHGDAGACGEYISDATVGVWTEDPDAPARNVVIAATSMTTCP